jgi:hypothetical protein
MADYWNNQFKGGATAGIDPNEVQQFQSAASDELLAKRFMVDIQIDQQEKLKSLDYIDEAVLKSDMTESKEVLSYIMEKK